MIDPRWRKVLRDAWLHKSRTAMVIAAMVVGLIGAGALLDAWALIERVTDLTYKASQPVSATLRLDRVDTDVLAAVRTLPAVADARARRVVAANSQASGTPRAALLYAYDDYTRATIGKLQPEAGPWPPRDGELIIERSALEFAGAAVGQPITLTIDRGPAHSLAVTGIARDVSLAPGWMDNVVYAFVTPATLAQLGAPADFNELQLRVRDAGADRDAVRRIAQDAKAVLEKLGRRVIDIDVPVPGEHMHAAQMNSLLFTQAAFALLTLIVCGFLVVNLVAAMLAGQVREIGIMKSIGASGTQIAGMYVAYALLLGAIASMIAVPAAIAIGRQYAVMKAEMLNFPLAGYSTPVWAIVVQLVAGCLLPVGAAAIPVLRGCRLSVADALRDIGIADAHTRRAVPAFEGLGRPLLLSLNNAFRKRGRLVLTLAALAAGGAVYLGAANLRVAVDASVDRLFASQRFDFGLYFAQGAPASALEATAQQVEGVARAEAWSSARATRISTDGMRDTAIRLVGLPPQSPLFAARIERGRWLGASDRNALVVSLALLRDDPTLVPGAEVALRVDNRVTTWTVVGVVESGPEKLAYVPRPALAEVRADNLASALLVATTAGGTASQIEVIRRLRGALEQSGIPVARSQRVDEMRRVVADHLLMVVQFLGVMGWVMIAVGGMGLASTMSLAVMERTREIGVLRAIGARHRDILALIETEGATIALLAWLIALPLSVPMSVGLAAAFGRIMFPVPAAYVPEPAGVAGWFVMVLLVSLFACAWPARRALQVTPAAALAYE